MAELALDQRVLRYCRQVIMQSMDYVRGRMREENLPALKRQTAKPHLQKSELNPTKAIDQEAEDLIIEALRHKFAKIPEIKAYTVFSEELGIKTFPEGATESDADLIVFIDPIDGTEFVETLQGGWSLIAVYDRRIGEVIAAVAGDIFLDRIYWASQNGIPECLDFITHSWFRLDGGTNPKSTLAGARVNVLTTKVDRYRALSEQTELLNAIHESDGRVNLSWGSNTIIQVAAGYADVAIEFAKGFATYDILAGFYIGLKTGLTILDLKENRLLPGLTSMISSPPSAMIQSIRDELPSWLLKIRRWPNRYCGLSNDKKAATDSTDFYCKMRLTDQSVIILFCPWRLLRLDKDLIIPFIYFKQMIV
jgi:fructose-1,6-bisphosphatase/inositol monophosphatase family enzyme